MPENMIARLGSSPMTSGNTKVRAEHGHDVLGAEPDGLAPREALVGRDGLTRGRIDYFPLEHRHTVGPFPWVEIPQIRPPRNHNVVTP